MEREIIAENDSYERLTLWGAIKDLGWFFALYAGIVGGLSHLQIWQSVFPHFRLTPLLQWIPDGWRQLLDFMDDVVEPWLMPAIHWLGDVLHLDLDIDPVWRPLFALMTVIWASQLRIALRRGALWRKQGARLAIVSWITHVLQIPALLLGALAAGVTMSVGGWLAQGLAAALPILFFQFFTAAAHGVEAVVFALVRSPNVEHAMHQVREPAIAGSLFGCVGFAFGACLSFAPSIERSAGVLALAGLVGVWGSLLTWAGLSRFANDPLQDRMTMRSGLTILGGFVAAGIIVAADVVVRLLGGA